MKTDTANETETLSVRVKLIDQGDLCHAGYTLYLAAEDEKDPKKKAALERVKTALHDITNWTGVEAIASSEIVGNKEYMKGKIA